MHRCISLTGLLLGCCLLCSTGLSQPSGDNIIAGQVNYPELERPVQRRLMYNKDGSRIMQADHPLGNLYRSGIISLFPLSFNLGVHLTPNATITQKEQTFIPHVLPVVQGSTVYLLNEDEFFHNIYSLTPGSRFNIGRRPPGSPYAIEIDRTGPIRLSCDIHPHMSGYILSLRTPYFTRTDADGSFRLAGLPDGSYRVDFYHPLVAAASRIIELNDGEVRRIGLEPAYH